MIQRFFDYGIEYNKEAEARLDGRRVVFCATSWRIGFICPIYLANTESYTLTGNVK
jgi:hypothetical protein